MAKRSKTPKWEDVGKTIGRKIEAESSSWKKHGCDNCCGCKKDEHSGVAGRAIFITGVLIALHKLGYTSALPWWLQVIIGVGFALMTF